MHAQTRATPSVAVFARTSGPKMRAQHMESTTTHTSATRGMVLALRRHGVRVHMK